MANPTEDLSSLSPKELIPDSFNDEHRLTFAVEAGIRQASLDEQVQKVDSVEEELVDPSDFPPDGFAEEQEDDGDDESAEDNSDECPSPLVDQKGSFPIQRRRKAKGLGATDGPLIAQLVTTDLWQGSSKDVRYALRKLSNLCYQGYVGSAELANTNASILYQTGGHLAVVQCMKKYRASRKVQEHGFGVLQNLTYWETTVLEPIGVIGGVNIILDSMRRFSEDEDVQKSGCRLLRNLVKERKNADLVGKVDGATVIVNAMTKFPHNQNLQRGAAGALRWLGEHEHLRQALARAGAIDALADAYAKLPSCSSGQAAARKALTMLMDLQGSE